MRQNHYGTADPLAPLPTAAIAARGDLLPANATLSGAIDAKVTTASWLRADLHVAAIMGPTTQGQPPFTWFGFWLGLGWALIFLFDLQVRAVGQVCACGHAILV